MVCNTTISISPETVTFMRDEHRQKKSLVIRNDGPQALMFKMKSTLAGALRMRPVHGQVEANASTTIKLELRWNSIVKRICVDSKKGRISVVFADAPHSSKPPPLFWREVKTQNKTTETITKKVQVKVESPTSHKPPSQATEPVTSSDDKPQKPPPAGTGSDKPKKTSKEKAGDAAAKPATTKPETPPPPAPSATNVKKPKEEARVALTDGQAKAANTPGDQAQAQAKPGMEKPKEASNEKPPTTVLVTMNEKPAPKAAVGTAKETSDSDSSSSSSSSSKEEKK
ncbi:hypothetical protein AAVH_12662 [Aphelenchoides avenae]|nr:hypothetical protein AAVH_12662 [Aphelenchus avenae]